MVEQNKIDELIQLLASSRNCIVISHTNPDGDAVGSTQALRALLTKAHPAMQVQVAYPNRFPSFLQWIEGAEQSLIYWDQPEQVADEVRKADLIFCLDFNTLSRIDELGKLVAASKASKVLIDHHIAPSEEFDLRFSDTSMSSTSELVYHIIVAMGLRPLLEVGAAEALYTGLVTDTGSFAHSVNSPAPFRMAADLMEAGIDKMEVASRLFNGYSESRLRLLGYCLKDKMMLLSNKKAAYIALSRDELEQFSFQLGDTEGFVNYPLSIEGVDVSAFFYETSDRSQVRISLRSKGSSISVNQFARSYFNGGGHFNAAGGRYDGTLADCILHFEQAVAQQEW